MGIVVRQSIKGTLVTYIGAIIGALTTFCVVTRVLTAEQLGLTRVLVEAGTILAGLSQLGTNLSIIRYYPYFKDESKKDHGFFFWTLVVPFIGFLIYSLIFVLLKGPICNYFLEKSALFVDYYQFIFPLGFFMLYMAVFESNANVLMRIVVPRFVREILVRLLTLAAYFLYSFNVVDFTGFIVIFCLVYALATIVDIVYLFMLKRVSLKPDWKYISKDLRRNYLSYTGFMVVSALAGTITPSINTFFVSGKMGLHFTGIFTIAILMVGLIEMPYRSLGAITRPQVSQAMRDNNIALANKLCKSVALHQFLCGLFVLFLIWINIDFVFKIIPNGDVYAPAKWVFFILGMAKIVYTSLGINVIAIGFSKYYYYSLLFTVLLTAAAIILNILFIPLWNMEGAAIASLTSYIIYFIPFLLLIYHKIGIQSFSMNQLKVLLVFLLFFAANLLWSRFISPFIWTWTANETLSIAIDCVIKSAVFCTLIVWIIYKLKVSVEVNKLIDRVCGQIRR
ncbi:MAG: oligosaccharide flippase family protein [Bacteroidales bacterium]|nr:oligosaccharide flippase family protein [Bacteroidales bacterium]